MESPLSRRLHAVATLLLLVGLIWQTYALSALRADVDGIRLQAAVHETRARVAAGGEEGTPARRPGLPRGLPGRIKPMDKMKPGGAAGAQDGGDSDADAARMDAAVARVLGQRKMARLDAEKERLMVRSTGRVEAIVDTLIIDGELDEGRRTEVEELMLDGVNEIWMLKGDVARGDVSDADARVEVEEVRASYLEELSEIVGDETAESMFNQMMGVSKPVR